MKILVSWLEDFVDVAMPTDELCHRLTMAGLESSMAGHGTVLDIEVTPNRPDWLSVMGIAWEVAALSGERLHQPPTDYPETGSPIQERVQIAIEDPELCHRYSASLVLGVRVGPSPKWLQERLLAAGMRPINNIVDITNYVMLEYGQPLHAFDWERLNEGRVLIRRARPLERLATLDGVHRALTPEMLVIADGRNPVAVAGVMGGNESEVSADTTAILLESANFLGTSVRRTSSKLNLRTEASIRFEKGISANLTVPALRRATQLVLEMAGGQAAAGIMDLHPAPQERPAIPLRQEDLRRTLGVDWPLDQAQAALISLGFDCAVDPDSIIVRPPVHRTDVRLMEDVLEEVARIVGYDSIPSTHLRGALPEPWEDPLRAMEDKIRDILTGYGLQDLVTYTLISSESLEKSLYAGPKPISLANPMSREQELLRPTLRPNLLSALATNQRFGEDGVWLFEIGKVFFPRESDLPDERRTAAAVICGPQAARSWAEQTREVDFYQAKGLVEGVFAHLGVQAAFELTDDLFFAPGRGAAIKLGDTQVGCLGEVHSEIKDRFELAQRPVCYLELDLPCLLSHIGAEQQRFEELPRYPGVSQDLSIVLDLDVPASRVLQIIESFPLVRKTTLFDLFTGGQLPAGRKSLTYSLLYQSRDRTLTGEEASQVHRQIVEQLERKLGATLRT